MPVATYQYQALKEALAASISTAGDVRRPHALAVVSGLAVNGYVVSLLVSRYFRLGAANAARRAFDAVPLPRAESSPVSAPPKPLLYNSMIRGYLALGLPRLAVGVFREMACPPDRHTYQLAMTACARAAEFELGRRVGSEACSRGFSADLLVGTALVVTYSEAGDMAAALRVFDGMPHRDDVVWNALIAGYARASCMGEALGLFARMRMVDGVSPTEATLVSLVSGFAIYASRKVCYMMHAVVVRSGFHLNVCVCNALLELYLYSGCLREAVMLFRQMEGKDPITWSTMIGGLVRNGRPNSALNVFHWMLSNSSVSATRSILLNVIAACAELGEWKQGRWIEQSYVLASSSEFNRDPSLVTSLIYMYAKCGQLDSSIALLHGVAAMRDDIVAWNAIIKGCGVLGQVGKAIGFAVEMQRVGVDPDAVTFLEILPMISLIPSLKKGMEAHGQIVKRGFQNERTIANSLITMYGRCGDLRHSFDTFTGILDKDVISWTSMVQVYAWNGHAAEVVELFELMKKTEVKPNRYTFLAVLSACKNTGLVEEGMYLLKFMEEQYGLEPDVEHISCVVDMLCRTGRLTDAYDLVKGTNSERVDNHILWGILLSASRSSGDLVIGEEAARHLLSLDPENRANYKMLADIYVSLGRRDSANNILRLSLSRGLDSKPGCSWTEGG
ncbi:pentatricopeptide repeat-containing protein At5g39350-like [Hordeum vulgare subsp. vulgare]|uniref:Pentatricopeptide repeat-containing protein n=1 Tax=Hordeum vulgare subsp. vulgare TaxID=112509 RepID=A0A8I6ZDY6_HORVV|nr:pentatricopeptide repeat-containing protein At5g39350-like [Hordeum vulgare subsp. vulgare]XP_044959133.1 pentatricopeptide repeat-containing protein At5g39350-like [Hordeum vulgare subsp. vulgare]XP_044959134.1 pentatricopeptide repeat-containing protein At5g39350-like [Hordeum vulgare subsp. vulgare]XP_044959135.1 pentatricopeptide repeat-containing protein At5g39350-like [Hordeum vulgare subsp. vulgare]XP_044959136.1 pentatricopeptide repeat-containing protein At5g39350-like [Hordeum vulg